MLKCLCETIALYNCIQPVNACQRICGLFKNVFIIIYSMSYYYLRLLPKNLAWSMIFPEQCYIFSCYPWRRVVWAISIWFAGHHHWNGSQEKKAKFLPDFNGNAGGLFWKTESHEHSQHPDQHHGGWDAGFPFYSDCSEHPFFLQTP